MEPPYTIVTPSKINAIELTRNWTQITDHHHKKKTTCYDEIIRPKGDNLCPYGRTRVVGEKGSGYRLPHWEASKGQAS